MGIFIPLLPTTPFIVLSAILFERSSRKFHRFILNNRIFGRYIDDYVNRRGISIKNKVLILSFLTLVIGSSFYMVDSNVAKIVLVIVFVLVSAHIILIKTLKEKDV
ncbi:MAG: YbaN family protein [Candidatus Zixiibacteriota bacterium]